ncbi:MAG: UvrD-helicase domain-containing protein [Thermodesulfobacteriota bacterium]
MMKSAIKNELAITICGKPKEITLDLCHGTFGRNNPLCSNAGKCRIAEKTDEQLKYIFSSSDKNVFLKACPGSGKTESVGLKAAYEIKGWKTKIGGIAVLSFTNSAADVISARAAQFAGTDKLRYPHFIGTIDSWLHGYIAHPFSHLITCYKGRGNDCSLRIVNESSDDDWLNAFKLDTAYSYYRKTKDGKEVLASMPLYANNIRYDYENDIWEIKVPASKSNEYARDDEYFASKAFSDFRKDKNWLTLEHMRGKFKDKKDRFNQAGFATYQDIENLCYLLLCNNPDLTQLLAERFPFLIIDECQDLSWIQLQIFKKLIEAGSCVHLVGDLNQGIYAFKKVYPQKVGEFVECHNFETLELLKNLRSVQPIVDLCGKIVNQGNVQGISIGITDPSCVYFVYDKGKMQEVVGWFVSYIEKLGITPAKSAIVARGYSTVNKLRPAASRMPHKKQLQLATAIHLWQNGGAESMGEALNCIGRFVADNFFAAESTNSRAYYCPDCVSSHLRWRLSLAHILDKCIEAESLRNLNQIWSEWAKTVRAQFETTVRSCLNLELPSQNNHLFSSFNALRGEASQTVISTLETVEKSYVSNILITTFHQVKGRTFDAMLVVSAPDKRGDGGHWSQWVAAANSDGEHARFAYVASSRPRALLGWAVPSPSGDEEDQLEELGFTVINEAGEKQ